MVKASLLLHVELESRGTDVVQDYQALETKTDLEWEENWRTVVESFAVQALPLFVLMAKECQKEKTEPLSEYGLLVQPLVVEALAMVAQKPAKACQEYPHLDGC